MKKEKGISLHVEILLKVLLAVGFSPVLFCVMIIGSNMDYYEAIKPVTVCSNWVLSVIAVLMMIVTVGLIVWCQKYPLVKKWDVIVSVILCVLFVGVYFVSVRIAREIAFHLPWDIGVVTGVAINNVAKDVPVGYFYYLAIFKNNIPISYILGKLFQWARESATYPYNPQFIWVQVNCVLMSLGGLFSCLTAKRLTKNLMVTILTFLLNVLLIGLSAWKIAPYTDTYGLLFPILCIYLYVCYKQSKTLWQKILLLFLSIVSGALGGFIKPNLLLVIIAILLTELIAFFYDRKGQWKYLLSSIFMTIVMLLVTQMCQCVLIEAMGIETNENVEAGVLDYFYMGLNEDTTGGYNGDIYAMCGEFQNEGKAARNEALIQRSWERIKEKGFFGLLYFWLRKMVMTFNDGMFGWSTEVWVLYHYEPVVSTNTALMDFLRQIYWSGPYEGAFNTIMQLVWIYCLCGIPGLCLAQKKQQGNMVLLFSFLGIFFYQMLFEARARYLFAFLPLIIVAATYGMYQYGLLISQYLKRKQQ